MKSPFKSYHSFLFAFLLFVLPSSLSAQCTGGSGCSSGQTCNTYCYDDGEVDVIAFEFCPTAGMAAQSTIIQGSFFATIGDNLTVYSGASGSGTGGTIVFGPSTGNLAGNVITSLGADQCLIFVINSNSVGVPISCADGSELELQVCSESIAASNVSFTAPADLCINAGVQNGLGGGLPSGGVYSGPGVTDGGNGMTYNFDPAAAGTGVHTLTYTNGGTASDDIEVFALGTATFTALADLCIDAGVQTGLSGGTPSGGIYSGPGVTDNGNGTYDFNPALAGLGVHAITYTEAGGCMNSASDMVEVLAACGCPVGQTSHFHCSSAPETDLVIFEICPTAGALAQATINAGTYSTTGNNLTVYQGASGSATGGTILYGPQTGNLAGNVITGTAIDQCLIFVSNTIAVGCQQGFETALEVCGESLNNPVFFTALGDLCIDDGVQNNLTGGIPSGGVYSGTGVTDDGNGMTYSFDPTVAGVGTHTLTYTQGGNSVSDDVEVFAVPTVSFLTPPDLCIDAGTQINLGGGTPIGGVYSGSGVTDNGNGLTYSFDPLAAGLGTHTITYTEGGVCMEIATDDIEVIAACSCPSGETTYFNCYDINETNLVIFEICPNAGEFAKAEISQGTYGSPDDFLTIYQGASGSGTGGTIVFGPTNGNFSGNSFLSTTADECLIFVSNSGPFGSCADGFELPLIVCGSSLTSNVTFTALPDLSVNAGIQTGLGDGFPTGGVYSGPGVTDDGNGMTYTFDPAVAGVGVHTLTYTVGGNSASDDVEVLNLLPPAFSKSFSPTSIGQGSVTTLTFTINNTNSGTPATSISFTDNLPAGMTIASPPAITNDCFMGTVTAVAGGTTISLSDGELPGSSSCTISVNVTSSTIGTSTNITGDMTSSSGNSGSASANLTVNGACPVFTKSFSPSTVNTGQRSTLTFTIDNTAGAVDLNSAQFIDNLPGGMVIASPANLSISCTNMNVTAVPGTSVINVSPTVFGQTTVTAGSSCTISVDVVANTAGTLDNITENFSIRNNVFQVLNCGFASAALVVNPPGEILLQKSFSTNPATPGGTTDLVFTITNLNRDHPATNISFTDDLTSVLAGLTATGTPLNDICGVGSQLSGTTLLTFTGGTIPADGSCSFSIPISIPAGAALGTYTNETSNITATINGSTEIGNPAIENLFIKNVPTFTKTFLNDPILGGGTTTLEFTITNTSSTTALTDITFTDVIDDFLNGSTLSNLPAAGSCGAGSFFFTTTVAGQLTFQMIGGSIPANSSCTFSVDLTIPTNTISGTYTNTTSLLSGTVDGGTINAEPATDDLTVLAIPTLTKTFLNDPVNAGSIVNLEFTISYDESATGDATNISFTDDLNAVIPGLAAVGLPLNDICGTGSSISGTTNLTFSGGTLSPGGTCTFTVPVQIPAGVVPGSYTNVTSALTAMVGGQSGTGGVAIDDLDIGGISFTKEFLNDEVLPGETTTLRFTIDNTSAFDASNVFFTDNFSSVIPGMVAQAPLPTAPCGASSVTSGTSFFVFFNGEVNAGTSCSFDVDVLVPANAANGTYTNTTSNLSATLNGSAGSFQPASDNIVVNNSLISLTKTFTDDPVIPGGTVTVEYTLTNLDAVNAISDIAFTDDFDALLTGLQATGLPMSVCGGTVSGTGLLSFTGGTLAAGASCTFSVTLQTPTNASYGAVLTCPTSDLTGNINGIAVTGDPASDDLVFQSLEFTKSMTGPVAPGGTTTLTFTITNNDPVNSINQIAFSDDLDAFISGMVATALPPNGSCGSLSEVVGTSLISFGRGSLGPGESCTFDVTALVPCGTAGGTYMNTTSSITADGVNGGIVSSTASNSLTVSSSSSADFTAPADLCIDAGEQTGLGGGIPTGGIYSGTGVTDGGNGMTYSFDPAIASVGTHTLTYTFTDGNGCTTSASDDIEIFALPVVTFAAPADLCSNDGIQTGLTGGTPSGDGTGVYSGPGVTDNGGNYDFNPATAGVGTHTLTYTFTDLNGCINSASDDIQVIASPNAMFTALADLCINAGVQNNLGGGTPTGGVYSGAGVTDDGNGMTYDFDPAAAGVGTHSVTYTVGVAGCTDATSDDVEVFALPIVSLTIPANQDEFCIDDATTAISLAGSPTGGVFSGNGVTDLGTGSDFTFNPAAAGVGTHTVTYTYTDANGCTNSATDDILVNPLPVVMFTAPADLCLNDGVQNNLGGGTPTGGVYSGAGVTDDNNGMTYDFDPAVAGVGTHTLTYTFTDANGCTNSASDDIQVIALPVVMFTAPADLCINAGVQNNLGGGTPTGGVYSGAGVTDDGNGMTYDFDPAAAGVGTHSVTYTVGVAGCTDAASDDVEVFALPIVSLTIPANQDEFCIDDANTAISLAGSPSGGVFSGNGVTDLGTGSDFTFNPATAGVGTHTVTYTFTDVNGCTNSATDDILVNPLPVVMFTAPADLCLNDGVQNNLGGGTPTGGVYSGAGVTDDGNGMTYDFDPAAAGVGTHTLTYTFTDANGCTNSASDDVEVFVLPIVMFTAPDDICVNAGVQNNLTGGSPFGGVYSGNGVTDGANGMTYSFDPAAAGVGTHTLTYTFINTNGCSANASDIIEVFNSVDVSFTAPADLCENAGLQTGLSGGMPVAGIGEIGVYSGAGVMDDGNGMTYSFDPAIAGVGTHTITYTYTSADGCSGSDSDDVEVLEIPEATFTVSDIDGCEGNGTCMGTPTLITPLGTSTNLFKFYDADPNAGNANLLAGPIASYDPMTTAATSPQSIWVVECLPGVCDSEAEEVVVTIVENPTPTLSIATLPTNLSCEMVGMYSAPPATFDNGLMGDCENSGSVSGMITPNFTSCGGSISISYSGTDNCGNTLTAGPFLITVDPATPPLVTPPSFPTSAISCEAAQMFMPGDATYTNDLMGSCLISGSITPMVTPNFTACGGTITVMYSDTDICNNTLTSGPFIINVDPATPPTLTLPMLSTTLSCDETATFDPDDATYTNMLTGDCLISGNIEPQVQNNFTACGGGTITVTYSGMDVCNNLIAAPPIVITVSPAPSPVITIPIFPTSLNCEMATIYSAPDLTFDNGVATGPCSNVGSIAATTINSATTCMGGTVTITYSGQDNCGNTISEGPFIIPVDPPPPATLTTPTLPTSLSCEIAATFIAPEATYENGLTGNCENSGSIPAMTSSFFDACGGTIIVNYSGTDDCGNLLSAGPFTINVQAAPIPTISLPTFPSSISCENAGSYNPPNASVNNGLQGTCNLSGNVTSSINHFYDACGGVIEIIYTGKDDCGRNLAAVVGFILVDPAPAPTVFPPVYPSELNCSEAESLVGLFATYHNGQQGECEISGFLPPQIIKNVSATSGGTVTINYNGMDNCGNSLSSTPIIISVLPASLPSIQLPDDPSSIFCWDAENYTPGVATFSNGEQGFCENSGELDLTTIENFWNSCEGGYIVYQYSGFDNAGNFLQTDLLKVVVLPDTWAPQGECVDLDITLSDIKDVPGPDELAFYQNQIASNYYDDCGNVNVVIVSDSGTPECDADNQFERVYEFEITDDCGNIAGNCSITFSGTCNPLFCTFTQDFYSSPDESFGGLSSLEIIDLLIGSGANPIVIGTDDCGFVLEDAECIQVALSGQGQSISLPNDFQLNCGTSISNSLINQIITTTLNISYNATLNGSGLDFGDFLLEGACMNIPQSIIYGLPENPTVNDLIDYANNFIGCQCSNSCGEYNNVMADLTGIFQGLNSRFNKCHVPGPCFLDSNEPSNGLTFEPSEKEENIVNAETNILELFLENKKLKVNLYPNPTDGDINVKLNDGFGKSCLVEIFDARGQKVSEISYPRLEQDILYFDLQEFERGVYWMAIKLDGFDQTVERFIIVK